MVVEILYEYASDKAALVSNAWLPPLEKGSHSPLGDVTDCEKTMEGMVNFRNGKR